MNDNIFIGMVENLENNFFEISTDVLSSLRDTNEEYKALHQKRLALQSEFPCIQNVFEGETEITITSAEHKVLLEYIGIVSDMENIERLQLYYAGHRDCFAYFKKIGVI